MQRENLSTSLLLVFLAFAVGRFLLLTPHTGPHRDTGDHALIEDLGNRNSADDERDAEDSEALLVIQSVELPTVTRFVSTPTSTWHLSYIQDAILQTSLSPRAPPAV